MYLVNAPNWRHRANRSEWLRDSGGGKSAERGKSSRVSGKVRQQADARWRDPACAPGDV